jgi:phage-related protein
MEDIFKPTGPLKSSKTDAGGGNTRPEAVIGVVKNNIDPTRAGRIQVYIQDIGANDPDDSQNWVTVSFLSPFFGMTPASGPNTGYGDYLKNPASYGVWNSPPDLGTEVVCMFINGDMNYGFYIGCVPKPEALHMVPAIGSSKNVITNEGEAQSYGGATQLPVSNINTNNTKAAEGIGFLVEPRPVHSYAASILSQQGLVRDTIRGPITSSASRESPSRVGYGVSTPGRPIYEGGYSDTTVSDNLAAQDTALKVIGRRSGHSFVMDDGDLVGRDQLIRLRSSLGHQILMSDDGQCLFIIHANGQSWIELGKEGTIDMYATNSVNVRTQGDLNLHADNNININAAKDLNISAGENITMTSEKATKFKAGTDFNQYTIGKYTVKVNGAMSMDAAGEASYASTSTTYINGSKVNLNTGSTGTTPAEVPPIPVVAHTDTLFDATKGYASAPGKLLSIVSRAPAHMPWANAGQGVDVKVNTSASASLPTPPSSAASAANNAVSPAPANPVTAPVAATVPNQGAVSTALDKNTTATMVGAVTRDAALGPAADAVKAGMGVVTDAAGKLSAVVGPMALTPAQLEASGDLKPGAATLINGLVQQGKTVTQAMTSNLFTGVPGAENLPALAQNVEAQVKATVTNFQQAQTALTQAGVMTGKEAPAQIAGLVMSGATAGIQATTDFVKNASGAISGAIGSATGAINGAIGAATGAVSGAVSAVSSAISAGNFAANMSQTLTGGMGSIAGALSGVGSKLTGGLTSLLDSAKGVAGSAFSAVTAAFKPLQAGVPQNLKAIAEKSAAEAAAAGAGLASAVNGATGGLTSALNNATGALTDAVGSATGALNGAIGSVTGGISGAITGAVSSVTGAVTGAISSVTGAATSLISTTTSGLSGIPGGQSTISSVVNNSLGAINTVPGLGPITDLVKNTSTAVTNSISGATAALSSVTGTIGGASSLLSTATTALTGASSALNGATAALSGAIGSATGALNNLTGQATGLLSKGLDAIKSGTDSLASLATAGLPPAAAAQLNAAINSLSAGGPIPIKLPTVAVGTNDRSEITAQLSSVLGSTKIPLPNFTAGISKAATSKADNLADKAMALLKEKEKQDEVVDEALNTYKKAKATLPQGDPELEILKAKVGEELEKTIAIAKKMSDLANA